MRESLIESVRSLLEGSRTVRAVTNDPVLAAELLLLIRTSYADGAVHKDEARALVAICTKVFGLDAKDLREVLRYLTEYSYETTAAQAAQVLANADIERKRNLVRMMVTIMRADGEIHDNEMALLRSTADRLGVDLGEAM